MKLGTAFVPCAQAFELVQPSETALDYPADGAQPGTVFGVLAGDARRDPPGAQRSAVTFAVVGPVTVEVTRPLTGPASGAADLRDSVNQRDQLGAVVAVASGQRYGQGNPTAVGDQVVLGTGASPIDGRGARRLPPLSARTCEPSTTMVSRSSCPSARNWSSSSSCTAGNTPASVQSRNRRQHVTPEHPATSCGSSRQVIPVLSTNTIPASAARSSAGSLPGYRVRRGGRAGSNGTTRRHNSSGTSSSITAPASPTTRGHSHQTRRSF